MAALLLGKSNILVLDEPGNHLDVETVEALADALIDYKGTVIFTAHDRHFMKRVASCIIEVKDGTVVNYRGDYDAYLYMVNKEIDKDENERKGISDQKQGKAEPSKATSSKSSPNTGSPTPRAPATRAKRTVLRQSHTQATTNGRSRKRLAR